MLRIALAFACSFLALQFARKFLPFFPTRLCSSPHLHHSLPKSQEEIEAIQESLSSDLDPELDDTVTGGIGAPIDSHHDGQMSRKHFSRIQRRENSKTKLSYSEEDASDYEIAKPRFKSDDADDPLTSLDETEITRLKNLVKDMGKEERKLEARILECCRLKTGPKNDHDELERQLAEKDTQIQSLHLHIVALEAYIDKAFQDLSEKAILQEDLQTAKTEIKELQKQIRDDASHTKARLLCLKEQLGKLQETEERNSLKELQLEENLQAAKELEVELPELHQRNEELQQENQEIRMKVADAETRAAEVSAVTERYLVAKAEAEASELRHANEHLSKLAESLQINRFMEVDELVYLRWVNACLRHELDTYKSSCETSPSTESSCSPPLQQHQTNPLIQAPIPTSESVHVSNSLIHDPTPTLESLNVSNSLTQPPIATSKSVHVSSSLSSQSHVASHAVKISFESKPSLQKLRSKKQEPKKNFLRSSSSYLSSPSPHDSVPNIKPKVRRHSASMLDAYLQRNVDGSASAYSNHVPNKYSNNRAVPRFSYSASFGNRRDLSWSRSNRTGSPRQYLPNGEESIAENTDDSEKVAASFQLLSAASSLKNKRPVFKDLPKTTRMDQATINEDRGMEIFKDSPKSLIVDQTTLNEDERMEKRPSPRIGERKDQSMPLLAVKIDGEAQRNIGRYLAKDIQPADYSNIEDVVAFVNWLDVEVAHMIDEQAALEHFGLSKKYINALREAALDYQYMKKLEGEIGSYEDEPKMPCHIALEALLFLQEKVEDYVYAFLQSRETAIVWYKQFSIPTYWMLDSGLIGEIKLASVQLAQKFMKRVIAELDAISKEEPLRHLLLEQAARFAFRVHQFAGGFDMKTMCTFKDLKSKADDLPDCQLRQSHSKAAWESKMHVKDQV